MEAEIMVLPDKSPELAGLEFSRLERLKEFVGIDRVRLEFQDERFNVGGGSLNGAHATHTRNGLSPIITMTESRLHDAPVSSQGSRPGNVCGRSLVLSIRYTYHVFFVKLLHRDSKFQGSENGTIFQGETDPCFPGFCQAGNP